LSVARLALTVRLWTALAVPFTWVVYALILVRSLRVDRVHWRGIEYHVEGPWEVRMLGYLTTAGDPREFSGA